MLDVPSKVRFLSILNGTCPGRVHGAMYNYVVRADVIKMVADGLIECAHPKEWGGETAWPAPAMSITEKGREWLNANSTLITTTSTYRVCPGEKQPESHNGFYG